MPRVSLPRVSRLSPDQRALAIQALRFIVTGGAMTLMVALAYWLVARFGGVPPMLALTIVFVAFTGVGYVLHSRISFAGHGARDNPGVRTVRFFVSNIIGFLVNQGFVWLLTVRLGGPEWWPVIPIIFVTPILSFTLNRRWVFG